MLVIPPRSRRTYATLHDAAETFKGLIGPGGRIARGEGDKQRTHAVNDFKDAVRWLIEDAERNLTKQRYKGLGEMNPDQLWETTMDVTARRLLRVQIEDAIAADGIFATLMGMTSSRGGRSSRGMQFMRGILMFDL